MRGASWLFWTAGTSSSDPPALYSKRPERKRRRLIRSLLVPDCAWPRSRVPRGPVVKGPCCSDLPLVRKVPNNEKRKRGQ